jgi:phosphatidylinositol 4-kinase
MQAALKDLALTRHDSQSFIICQRTLTKCQEIIFGDLPPPASTPYAALSPPFQSRFTRRKVRPHIEPALVGLSVVLAGVPGFPKLTEIMGQVAIEQGRIDDEAHEFKSLESQDDRAVTSTHTTHSPEDNEEGLDQSEMDHSIPTEEAAYAQQFVLADPIQNRNPHLARRRTIGAAQTTPVLPFYMREIQRSRSSCDPLDQLDGQIPTARPATPCQSSPSISVRTPLRSTTLNPAEVLLQRYDLPSQIHLLRSQYCRSEVCRRLLLISVIALSLVIGAIFARSGKHFEPSPSDPWARSCQCFKS